MKLSSLLCAVAGCALAASLEGAKPPVEYAEARDNIVYNYYKAPKGDWNDAKNWSRKRVPAAGDDAIVRDNAQVVIAAKAPDVRVVGLGGQKASTITLSEGGSLTVLEKFHVSRSENNAVALLVMDGGYLRVGSNAEFSNAALNVGTSATHSSRCAVEINAGTFEGGMNIGATLETATGKVTIRGTKPIVRGLVEKRDGLNVYKTGTIEFVLDASGIASLDYGKTWLSLKEGALLRADGAAYQGPSQTFTLISAKKVYNGGAKTECAGFDPAKYKAELEITAKGVFLKVRKL